MGIRPKPAPVNADAPLLSTVARQCQGVKPGEMGWEEQSSSGMYE
jgi:hypothetical protein